jgi:hypothetical protein
MNIVKANKKRYSGVFSILGISLMDAVDAVVGELAVAVGNQQYYFRGRPVGVKKYVRVLK